MVTTIETPIEPETRGAPRVLGVDLSLSATGMSDGSSTWLIRSTGHRDESLADRHERLAGLAHRVVDDVVDRDGDLVVIEGPSLGQGRQSGTHDRSGLWWLVVHRLHARGLAVVEVPPAALKKYATGKGNANKGAVIDATARRFPHVDTAADDNRCDALWLAAMGLDWLTGSGVVPAAQRAGLAKVAWPSVEVAA
jgi:crossover junction endodeoxyribonuclease RuvC